MVLGDGGACAPPERREPAQGREEVTAVRAFAATILILVVRPPLDLPMDCGPFSLKPRAVGMRLDNGAVHRHHLKPDAHYPLSPQALECPVQGSALGPTVHSGVDGVPSTESLGKPSPRATVPGNVKNGVERLEVADAHIASLHRQVGSDPLVLFLCNLHALMIPIHLLSVNTPSQRKDCQRIPGIPADGIIYRRWRLPTLPG